LAIVRHVPDFHNRLIGACWWLLANPLIRNRFNVRYAENGVAFMFPVCGQDVDAHGLRARVRALLAALRPRRFLLAGLLTSGNRRRFRYGLFAHGFPAASLSRQLAFFRFVALMWNVVEYSGFRRSKSVRFPEHAERQQRLVVLALFGVGTNADYQSWFLAAINVNKGNCLAKIHIVFSLSSGSRKLAMQSLGGFLVCFRC